MTKSSAKKLSFLGLVLVAASAVAATGMTKKAKPVANEECNGKRITDPVDNKATCTRAGLSDPKDCHLTLTGQGTTGTGNGTGTTANDPEAGGCD